MGANSYHAYSSINCEKHDSTCVYLRVFKCRTCKECCGSWNMTQMVYIDIYSLYSLFLYIQYIYMCVCVHIYVERTFPLHCRTIKLNDHTLQYANVFSEI